MRSMISIGRLQIELLMLSKAANVSRIVEREEFKMTGDRYCY
jgi:hypothetical protein